MLKASGTSNRYWLAQTSRLTSSLAFSYIFYPGGKSPKFALKSYIEFEEGSSMIASQAGSAGAAESASKL